MERPASSPLKIFISHSSKDREWLDAISGAMRVLERRGVATFWDRSRIRAGESEDEEIQRAIDTADVALLLLSADYLASDYVVERQLPALLGRKRTGDLVIIPIIVRTTILWGVPGIEDVGTWPADGVALAARSLHERDALLASLVDEIARIAGAISEATAERLAAPSSERSDLRGAASPHVFISHSKADLDFAEVLKLRLERARHSTWFDADRLKAGIDWREEIDDALRNAIAVIVVMSPDARGSDYVTYEWSFAVGANVPVVPLLLRHTVLHPRLAVLQHLDFRQGRPWSQLMTILGELALRHRSASPHP